MIAFSCSEDVSTELPEKVVVPQGFPDIMFPEDNPYTLDAWLLGKDLFYDPILSADSTISCASCHLPELAFSDGLAQSIGINNRTGNRNAPSLANIAYHPYFTREGGVPTLEMQVLVPIQEHDEMGFNIVLAAERLRQKKSYHDASLDAFNRLPDPYVITRALANFERTLLSGNSKYDYYLSGQLDLTKQEKRGLKLFNSEELKCNNCHGGHNFTDYRFANNGLYEIYEDSGRRRLTDDPSDEALFKTPSLRNIEITGPYMHDGSMRTIEAVIDHYAKGGNGHANQSPLIQGFEIDDSDKKALVAFLKTLTDHEFLNNDLFKKE